MNKRIMKLMVGGAITLFLIGCSNSATKKYENALASLESNDYETSISLLEEVLEKDPDNNKAKEIIAIISDYKKALELSKEDKIEEAKEILDNISENYNNYMIKDDINSLVFDLEKRLNDKEVVLVDDMFKKARALFEEGKYNECKEFLDSDLSPKVKASDFLPEDTKIALESLYLDCDKFIEENARIAKEEEEKAKAELALKSETYSSVSNTSSNSNSSNNINNVPSQNTPQVVDESSNPYSDGLKYINGFEYVVNDGNHWEAKLYYNLVCAGMYNKIKFNTPVGELTAILYYSDDESFVYESSYNGSYGSQRFGTYNGRSVHCVKEFNY